MIAIGVVAHTTRSAQAKALARSVKADFVSIDNGLLGCDDNHEHVQHHLANLPSTWSIVLEDDALPVEDFRAQAHAALLMAPSPVVSFYLGRQRPVHWQRRVGKAVEQAQDVDAHWIVSTHLLHAVGYAIRTELIPSLLDHMTVLPIDQHIGSWARHYGHTVSYTYGSLVDHDDGPTIVDHPDGQPRTPGRKAWAVGGHERWTTNLVALR